VDITTVPDQQFAWSVLATVLYTAAMRFSLRTFMLAMAYVAFVAGAIVSRSRFMADIVWALTFTVFCYAVITAFAAQDRRRAMAIGFALFATGHFACLFAAESRVPLNQVISLVGYQVSDELLWSRLITYTVTNADGKTRLRSRRQAIENSQAFVRTSNAVGTMLAGLIGCGIGALAYRHSNSDS
jgi:hypothetical protein